MTTWGSWYWPAFLIGSALAFAGPELYALFTNWRNTLSEYVWLDEPGTYSWEWVLSLSLWALFAIWITGHIWWRIWR